LLGQSVHDEVEIQFAGDRDIKTGHRDFRMEM
jgi:hypothetical protein